MLYMMTFTINTPQMLAYIPAPWILWEGNKTFSPCQKPRGFQRPHGRGALLPATSAEQGIKPRPGVSTTRIRSPDPVRQRRKHWGAQRKLPAVALTLVILLRWVMGLAIHG